MSHYTIKMSELQPIQHSAILTDEVSCTARTVFTPSCIMRSPNYLHVSRSGYVSCVMIAAARVHSWEAWRMAGSVPACITHIMLPSSHQHCTSHSGLGRSYLCPLSWGTNTNAGILSCSGLISIHVAVTDAGRAVFLCLLLVPSYWIT